MHPRILPLAGLLALALLAARPALAEDEAPDAGDGPGVEFQDWPSPGPLLDEEDQRWELELPRERPRPPAATPPRADAQPERRGRRWPDIVDYDHEARIRLDAFWLPVVGLRADVDRREPGRGIEWNARAKTGEGLGARFGVGDVVNVGLLYLASRHAERTRDTTLEAHSLYLDVLLGGAINEGPLELSLYLGAGVGGAIFDFEEGYHDTGGAALNLRLQTGLRIFEHVELEAGAGYFLWGYPGETVGHGGFLQLGLALRF